MVLASLGLWQQRQTGVQHCHSGLAAPAGRLPKGQWLEPLPKYCCCLWPRNTISEANNALRPVLASQLDVLFFICKSQRLTNIQTTVLVNSNIPSAMSENRSFQQEFQLLPSPTFGQNSPHFSFEFLLQNELVYPKSKSHSPTLFPIPHHLNVFILEVIGAFCMWYWQMCNRLSANPLNYVSNIVTYHIAYLIFLQHYF